MLASVSTRSLKLFNDRKTTKPGLTWHHFQLIREYCPAVIQTAILRRSYVISVTGLSALTVSHRSFPLHQSSRTKAKSVLNFMEQSNSFAIRKDHPITSQGKSNRKTYLCSLWGNWLRQQKEGPPPVCGEGFNCRQFLGSCCLKLKTLAVNHD